jgi:hypothetical protein
VPEEPPTRPGRGVGMYASDYRTLARVLLAIAEARVALLTNHTEQVRHKAVRGAAAGHLVEAPRVPRVAAAWPLVAMVRPPHA